MYGFADLAIYLSLSVNIKIKSYNRSTVRYVINENCCIKSTQNQRSGPYKNPYAFYEIWINKCML